MKIKNKLTDLNDHLFAQLERLNNEDMPEEKMAMEIERSKAVGNIAKNIITNGRLLLDSKKHFDEMGIKTEQQPDVLKIGAPKDEKQNKPS